MLHLAIALTASTAIPAAQLGLGDSLRLLTDKEITAHFELHARPGSRAAAALDRTAYLLELEYARVLHELGIAGRVDEKTPFHLFLYDSVAEIEKVTEIGGTGGFSAGRESHVPWEDDQTRLHELIHIVVAAMETTGDEPRNLFFAEGLANALLRFVHGVPVHAVAAYERRRGSLPALRETIEHPDFYAYLGEHPGLNAYDVGGSFFRYLLDRFDAPRVMDYYHGRSIEEALGLTLTQAEEGWHATLDATVMRPALMTLLSQRRGDGGQFSHILTVDERLGDRLGDPREWTSVLHRLAAVDEHARWRFEEGLAAADNPSGADWSIAEVPEELFADCMLRARVKVDGTCWGVKLRYGACARAMVLGQGTFVYSGEECVASSPEFQLRPDAEVDLLLVVREGRAEVYVDGAKVLEAEVATEPSRIGVGVVGGKAEFHALAVRRLPAAKETGQGR